MQESETRPSSSFERHSPRSPWSSWSSLGKASNSKLHRGRCSFQRMARVVGSGLLRFHARPFLELVETRFAGDMSIRPHPAPPPGSPEPSGSPALFLCLRRGQMQQELRAWAVFLLHRDVVLARLAVIAADAAPALWDSFGLGLGPPKTSSQCEQTVAVWAASSRGVLRIALGSFEVGKRAPKKQIGGSGLPAVYQPGCPVAEFLCHSAARLRGLPSLRSPWSGVCTQATAVPLRRTLPFAVGPLPMHFFSGCSGGLTVGGRVEVVPKKCIGGSGALTTNMAVTVLAWLAFQLTAFGHTLSFLSFVAVGGLLCRPLVRPGFMPRCLGWVFNLMRCCVLLSQAAVAPSRRLHGLFGLLATCRVTFANDRVLVLQPAAVLRFLPGFACPSAYGVCPVAWRLRLLSQPLPAL